MIHPSSLTVLPYTLPDAILYRQEKPVTPALMVWQPHETCLVLGAGNTPEKSLFTRRVLQDGIPVYKRPSGGESVILTPKTLVISVRLKEQNHTGPHPCFDRINHRIIASLESEGVQQLRTAGISDIAIGEKKILGSSIYRKRSLLFYHAVLNVAESTDLIGKYLKHPRREPDYRKNRDHAAFITSLHASGYPLDLQVLRQKLDQTLSGIF